MCYSLSSGTGLHELFAHLRGEIARLRRTCSYQFNTGSLSLRTACS